MNQPLVLQKLADALNELMNPGRPYANRLYDAYLYLDQIDDSEVPAPLMLQLGDVKASILHRPIGEARQMSEEEQAQSILQASTNSFDVVLDKVIDLYCAVDANATRERLAERHRTPATVTLR